MKKIRCKKCKGKTSMITYEEFSRGAFTTYPVGSICLKCMSVHLNSQFTNDLQLEESHWQDIGKSLKKIVGGN